MKKLSSFIPILAIVFAIFTWNVALSASYSQELQEAYDFAYKNKITTQNSIDKADMYWWLTRIAMAKMLSQYAINILWKTPNTSKIPNFWDVNSKLDWDYNNWVTLAYQLWIMWVWIDKFRPFDSVTRAEFWTALSRVLYWNKYEWGSPYYTNHLNALKTEGIMKKIDNPLGNEIRWFVMLMLMRANFENNNKSANLDRDLLELDEKNTENINYVENNNSDSEDYDYIVTDLWYKDSKLNIWWITCFNQIKIEKKVRTAQNIKYIRIKELNNKNFVTEDFWFENLKWEKVTEGEEVINQLFTDWNTESLILCAKLKENYWSGHYNFWFIISNVDSHTKMRDRKWWTIYVNKLKYKIIKEKNKDEILSFTVNGSVTELEILKENNEKCPTVFRRDGSYEIFKFIIHKKERDPEVYIWKIEIIWRGTRLKQWLKDLEIYANGKKIDSNNYKRKFLNYYDGAWWEMQPISISFDKKLDIDEDTEIIIKWKFWWSELNDKLEDFSHYNCLQGRWQAGFDTKFTYEKKNIIEMFDKKSWNLIPSEKTIIDESWIFRFRTLNIIDNNKVSFENEQHYVYTCDTLVDYNTTNRHNNYALWVGYWNSFEDNFGRCKINNSSSNDSTSSNSSSNNSSSSNSSSNNSSSNSSSSNDSTSSNSSSNNSSSSNSSSNNSSSNSSSSNDSTSSNSSSNNSSSNSSSSNNSSSNNSSSNDSSLNDSSWNDSSSTDNSSNNSKNCVDIEVDDWKSYNFCIVKWKSNDSKFSVKVDNAKDLSLCTVWKGGQNYDFYNCEWDISSMWSSWISQLRLSIKYNNKTYSKKVDYDLTNWVFMD